MPKAHYPEGTYEAQITSQRFGETPTGSAYFAVEFEPFAAKGVQQMPDRSFRREFTLYFTEKAAPYSIDNLRRIGWSGSSLAELDPSRDEYVSLAGAVVEVYCEHNEKGYEDWSLSAPGRTPGENDSSVASKLDKLFGKAVKASAGKANATVPPKQQKPAKAVEADASTEDDDIPF